MPQLAPLHWLILSLTFWFMIAFMMSFLWWTSSPKNSVSQSPMTCNAHRLWKW